MASLEKQYSGRRPQDYKRDIPGFEDSHSEASRVAVWNQRIRRHQKVLNQSARGKMAAEVDTFLANEASIRGKKIYMPYLLPMLTDGHRRTLPALPVPQIEATDDIGEAYADQVRELVRKAFNHPRAGTMQALRRGLWDDDRVGIMIIKTVWRMDYSIGQPDRNTNPDVLLAEQEKANQENADPLGARLSDSDLHEVHSQVHANALAMMDEADEGFGPLTYHYRQHVAEQAEVRQEWVGVERVHPLKFVYDTDVPWDDRGWETEERSMRIQEMLRLGYKNVNPVNLRVETKPGEEIQNWEDMTALVWEIHDRRNNKALVIPKTDHDDGLFLHEMDWPNGKIETYHRLAFTDWQPDEEQGLPTGALCIPILRHLAQIDTANAKHVKEHANYKPLFPKGTITKADWSRLNNPESSMAELPPEALAMMKEKKPPPLPPGNIQMRSILLDDLRRLTGSDPQDEGSSHPHQISATESGIRDESSNARREEQQERLGKMFEGISESVVMLYGKYATKNLMLRLVTPKGIRYAPLDPSDLPNTLTYHVDLQAESDITRAIQFESAKQWGEIAVGMGYPLKLIEWAEDLARKANITHPERYRADMDEQVGAAPPGEPSVPGDNLGNQGTIQFPPQEQTA